MNVEQFKRLKKTANIAKLSSQNISAQYAICTTMTGIIPKCSIALYAEFATKAQQRKYITVIDVVNAKRWQISPLMLNIVHLDLEKKQLQFVSFFLILIIILQRLLPLRCKIKSME
jgi:hypothetical protein